MAKLTTKQQREKTMNTNKKYQIIFSKKFDNSINKKTVKVKSLVSLIMEVDALKTKYELENEHILEIQELA